jgi:hypothetical protein
VSWLRDRRTDRLEAFADVMDLVGLGYLHLERFDVLPCVDEDDFFGGECDGWSLDEGFCPLCGADIWAHDRERFALAQLALQHDAVIAALTETLGDVRRLREGVAFSVEMATDDVLVVVAEWSDGTRWMRDATLRGRPFVLVVLDALLWTTRLGQAEWVVSVGLADVLRDGRVLQDAVRRAVEHADLPRSEPAVVELHRLTTRFVHVSHGARVVELRKDGVVVAGVSVPVSGGMRQVVALLAEQHIEDKQVGKAPDAYCAFTLAEMAEALGERRTTVQKQLWRFRQRLADRYRDGARRPLPEGAVVEQVDDGWRFSGECVVRKAS